MTPARAEPVPPVLAAVDPGKRESWLAVYLGGELALARCCPGVDGEAPLGLRAWLLELGALGRPGALVVERPEVYPGGRTRRPSDQVAVAVVAGGWLAAGAALGLAAREVRPAAWKGQLDKHKVERRLRAALSEGEAVLLDRERARVRADKRHNVVDCAAIGAWALGRVPLAAWDPRYARESKE